MGWSTWEQMFGNIFTILWLEGGCSLEMLCLILMSSPPAQLAVFIYYAVWKPQKQWITLDTGILESPFIYSPDKRQEAWRFISYMLVHAG